ncbi:PQQ-dependent catabolism-associated CXXCW motif protein [Chthonobacter albigriseus]|uniref:PQQ-dependent catabolism-associated CXXCW motif protein n=1 Tax=Chthonobacter albigriseus TaxID=1683161 RepID=UPI0015EFB5C3|nr:PQQ-dependent catabolism-associated CXXCW motif protein [Chthonobacter albigriseus]
MTNDLPDAVRPTIQSKAGAWALAFALSCAIIPIAPARAEDPPSQPAEAQLAEPDGYRMDEYRAPVPATLKGAKVISTAEAEALWKAGEAVFIDVLPKPPTPKLPKGTVFRLPPRDDIPRSIWLPDVGYGALNDAMAAYFRENLSAALAGDSSRPVVFYCLADCWMSWNAAKRAIEWGYSNVYWYPEGTDGWSFEGLPVETAEPVKRPGLVE